ncbi:tetratricopeptide repeat protein [Flammeovirga pacifica]|uniref:tetratricopeptide repeat protein n=1 Tax=Flammeovirga pacifica TaxID=915059 RepID=UPI001300FCB4|nr:tetratricopeptide repeat protein [Flammeovirga pacifica]
MKYLFQISIAIICLIIATSCTNETPPLSEQVEIIEHNNYLELDSVNNEIVRLFNERRYDSSIILSHIGLQIARENNLKKELGIFYHFLTKSLYKNKQYKKGQTEGLKAIKWLKKQKDIPYSGDIYITLARNSRYLNQYDSAIYFYKESIKYLEINDDFIGMSIAYNNIGATYKIKGDYTEALTYYLKDLELNKLHNQKLDQAIASNNIGQIMLINRDYDKALNYFNQAEEINRELNNPKGIALANSNIGSVYHLMEKFDESLQFFFTALTTYDTLDRSDYRIAETMTNIGNAYLQKNDLSNAIIYIDKALKINKKIKNTRGEMKSLYLKGECLFHTKKYSSALSLLYRAEKYYSQSSHYKIEHLNTLSLIHKCLSASKNFRLAYHYQSNWNELYKEINGNKNRAKIADLNQKYETSEKELLIEKLHKDQLIKEQKIRYQNKISIFLLLLSIILFTFIIFIVFIQKKKKKTHNLIKEQNIEITSIHTELLDSLRLARRIQYSLISISDKVKEVIPEHFIFWHPMHEVSGDVYHFEYKDNRLYVTLMDCTGHGAPASLMATLCIKTLNDIITDGAIHPDTILEELDYRMKDENSLEQSLSGVDASIIIYNFDTETIEFSGARRPVYFIDNEGRNHIKGTKRSICDTLINDAIPFERHTKKLTSDTRVYLYSDGFADQFGGPNNKKFKEPKLRNKLFEINELPLEQQQDLLTDTYWSWRKPSNKKENRATDDTLVLGFNFKINS